jgi:hypothetical protein
MNKRVRAVFTSVLGQMGHPVHALILLKNQELNSSETSCDKVER